MIDLHAHILAETDNGASSFEESVALLYEAKKAGFSGIICTPHYMQQFYEKDEIYISNKIKELNSDCKRIGIHLYQGNEVYISDEIYKYLRERKITRINGSKYLLMELPLTEISINKCIEVIEKIVNEGNIPIIANPERYPYIQRNVELARQFLKKGALLQSNYASIDSYYGVPAKKTIIKLLKNKMIQFLGSNVHKKKTIYPNMQKYLKLLSKYLSENELHELSYKNPIKVIHDENINIEIER